MKPDFREELAARRRQLVWQTWRIPIAVVATIVLVGGVYFALRGGADDLNPGTVGAGGGNAAGDHDELQLTVSYSTALPTNQDVTATISANREIQLLDGWGWVDEADKTAMTKTYQENQPVERLIVADLAGNKAEATVMIGNIDKTPLIVTSVWHSETGPTRNNVSVTFAVNKEIELPEGWRFRYNAQVYSRLFTASWSGGLLIRDLAGNTATVPIRVSIDRSLPGPIIEPEGHDDELE